MAVEYTELSKEQREQMLRQRIAQYESEHFGHGMNAAALASLSDEDGGKAQAIADAERQQAVLEASIEAIQKQLATLQRQEVAHGRSTRTSAGN